eukprot:3448838-Pleurochrysis_carterae.AAC.1
MSLRASGTKIARRATTWYHLKTYAYRLKTYAYHLKQDCVCGFPLCGCIRRGTGPQASSPTSPSEAQAGPRVNETGRLARTEQHEYQDLMGNRRRDEHALHPRA